MLYVAISKHPLVQILQLQECSIAIAAEKNPLGLHGAILYSYRPPLFSL
jgi:hypothetical protein